MEFWLGGAIPEEASFSFSVGSFEGVLIVTTLLAILVGLYLTRRNSPHRLLHLEMLLWTLGLALLGFALSQPTLISEAGRKDSGRFLVLIDRSASMNAMENGKPRSDEVNTIIQRIRKDVDSELEIFSFDSELHSGLPVDYTGMESDIGSALSQLNDRYLGQSLAGIAVLTDGIDRGALGQQIQFGTQLSLPNLNGPISFYQVGSKNEIFDVSILDVQSGDFAFQRMDFELNVDLSGPPNHSTSVILSSDGVDLEEQSIVFDDSGQAKLSFIQRPLQVGRFSWEVRVPVNPLDAAPANNVFPVVIKVVRENTRVLQVCGAPSYDQKFLRLFLKQDPSVELVSFFILRTHEDLNSSWGANELSLIEFPYHSLFSRDLKTFDLIVLQNFDYESYFQWESAELLQNITDYVTEGGALVMLGGDRSFDLGQYQNTSIAEILPVKLGVTGELLSPLPFQPQLTVSGSQHPIVQLSSTPASSRVVWERLSQMDGFNKNNGLASDAAVLLQHPTARTQNGEPVPILAVKEAGKGRVMSLGIDSSWRWSFSEAVEGEGNLAYLRFWKNALRWLQADPEDLQIVVTPERENALIGQEMDIEIWVRDTSYSSLEGVLVDGYVQTPSGKQIPISGTTGTSGESIIPFTPIEQGPHQIQVYYGDDVAKTIFAATSREPELLDLRTRPEWLKKMASHYEGKGKVLPQSDQGKPLVDKSAQREVPERVLVQLGAAPLWALLFGLFSSAAWIIRRRDGGR